MLGIFLDTETNGLNPRRHCPLEIAIVIQNLQSGKEYASYEAIIAQPQSKWDQSDTESLAVNGFTWEEVQAGKPIDLVASEILALLKSCDIKRGKAVFICQNPSFDRAFFSQIIDIDKQEAIKLPYHWLDLASMYWAKAHEPWRNGISKDAIASAHKLAPEAKPHRAMNGTRHLIACYWAVLKRP
ncbi:MAG TPA: 3'-5' exonuclease [Chlamydiales bacterium]|nr:3'-5' exonuclease [Chlamydiales bacterium]HPE84789.1 3'-5' exonuclease [Chlamydiales bacterium]